MIDENKMNEITDWLIDKVFQNEYIMLTDNRYTKDGIDLVDIIASLHNILVECVTGVHYDYMFHWANKVGAWCKDDMFDNKEDKE